MMIDEQFLEAYPRLYPTASTFGLTKEQVDELFSKLDGWRINLLYDKNAKELALKTILIKLEQRDETIDNLPDYKGSSDQELSDKFGRHWLEITKELLK